MRQGLAQACHPPAAIWTLPLAGMLGHLRDGTLQPYGRSPPPSTAQEHGSPRQLYSSPVIKWCCLGSQACSVFATSLTPSASHSPSRASFHRLRIVVFCHPVHHRHHHLMYMQIVPALLSPLRVNSSCPDFVRRESLELVIVTVLVDSFPITSSVVFLI